MKPRRPESPYAALARMSREIAEAENRDPEAGVAIAAAFLNLTPSTLYKQLDPDQPGGLSFARASQLSAHFRVSAAAEHLATAAGGVFLPLPAPDLSSPWGEASALAAEDFGRAMGELMRALSPHSENAAGISSGEARRILAELDCAVRDIALLRSLALAVIEKQPAAGEPSAIFQRIGRARS